MNKIVLGSKSPRRQELLKSLGFHIEIRTKEVEENFPEEMDVLEVAEYLAKLKSEPLRDSLSNSELLITSDTVVLRDNEILGKPSDRKEAIDMITSLSDKEHKVITGVCLTTHDRQIAFSNSTTVQFDNLELVEIEYYVDNFKPYDKAGAYGIQEWLGYIGIKKIEGCYYNVMGLPMNALYQKIKKEFPEFISLQNR